MTIEFECREEEQGFVFMLLIGNDLLFFFGGGAGVCVWRDTLF